VRNFATEAVNIAGLREAARMYAQWRDFENVRRWQETAAFWSHDSQQGLPAYEDSQGALQAHRYEAGASYRWRKPHVFDSQVFVTVAGVPAIVLAGWSARDPRLLRTFEILDDDATDAGMYPLNRGEAHPGTPLPPTGVKVWGRWKGDGWQSGFPWYLTSFWRAAYLVAYAERLLKDAAQGQVTWDPVELEWLGRLGVDPGLAAEAVASAVALVAQANVGYLVALADRDPVLQMPQHAVEGFPEEFHPQTGQSWGPHNLSWANLEYLAVLHRLIAVESRFQAGLEAIPPDSEAAGEPALLVLQDIALSPFDQYA